MAALLRPRAEDEHGDGVASARGAGRSTAMAALLLPEARGGARR